MIWEPGDRATPAVPVDEDVYPWIRNGGVYVVKAFLPGPSRCPCCGGARWADLLSFEGIPDIIQTKRGPGHGWYAGAFRKIEPPPPSFLERLMEAPRPEDERDVPVPDHKRRRVREDA